VPKKTILTIALLAFAAALGNAQSLGVSNRSAQVDGVVGDDEYGWSQSYQTITLHLSRTGDRLFAAVEAEAAGWVGIGFGSSRMDGAHIFLGYVRRGREEIVQHFGRGHQHRDTDRPVEFEYKLAEAGGVTSLEISVPIDAFIEPGQNRLELIIACGKGDRTQVYHSYRRGVVVDL
jgi:hypothetical protein